MFIEFPCFVSEIASVGDYTVSYWIESMFLGNLCWLGLIVIFVATTTIGTKYPASRKHLLHGSKIRHALLGQFIILMLVQFYVILLYIPSGYLT